MANPILHDFPSHYINLSTSIRSTVILEPFSSLTFVLGNSIEYHKNGFLDLEASLESKMLTRN